MQWVANEGRQRSVIDKCGVIPDGYHRTRQDARPSAFPHHSVLPVVPFDLWGQTYLSLLFVYVWARGDTNSNFRPGG